MNQPNTCTTTTSEISGLTLLLDCDWICSWERANPTCVYCTCGCKKQIIDRLREIKYASEGKVPWENFSLWLCLPEKSRERINVLQGITLMFMIGWNTEHQRSPLQKWKSFVDFSWPALAEVGCFDSPLTQRCWAPWTDFHESQARSAK